MPFRASEGPQWPYKALRALNNLERLVSPLRALEGLQGPYKALKGLMKPLRALQRP